MNFFHTFAAICITAIALSVKAAEPVTQEQIESEALKHCDRDQLSMNLCSFHKYKLADAELNELYKRLLTDLDQPNATRFRKAQRAWLKYMSAEPQKSHSGCGCCRNPRIPFD